MTQTLEQSAEVERPTGTAVLDERQPTKEQPQPVITPPEPSRFVRWLAWIVVVMAVVGTAGLIWWSVANPVEEQLVAPPIESIDPHQSPEILRTWVPVSLVAPAIGLIDPHESPEILRTGVSGSVVPSISSIDPHESPEILRGS